MTDYEVKIVRLSDSKTPDLIAEVQPTEDGYNLRNAHVVIFSQKGQDMSVNLMPFIPPYADDTNKIISLPKSAVFCFFEPASDMKNKFNAMFGSGLILPGNNKISLPHAGVGVTPTL